MPEELAPRVQRTIYRTVQEALTNVRKHAPGRRPRYGSGTSPVWCVSPSRTPRPPGPCSRCPARTTGSSDCASAPNCSAARSGRARRGRRLPAVAGAAGGQAALNQRGPGGRSADRAPAPGPPGTPRRPDPGDHRPATATRRPAIATAPGDHRPATNARRPPG
ncbi:hypothetical protein NKH77_29415 [Streptomyces sp. M19]